VRTTRRVRTGSGSPARRLGLCSAVIVVAFAALAVRAEQVVRLRRARDRPGMIGYVCVGRDRSAHYAIDLCASPVR